MNLRQTTPPAKEPVELAEVQQQLWLGDACEAGILHDLIATARQYVEDTCWLQLITAVWTWKLDGFEDRTLYVPRSPLQGATIAYLDVQGAAQTLSPSLYTVDAGSMPGRIMPAYGEDWPGTYDHEGAITITLTNGYGNNPADVPAPIRRAICVMVAHLYENRGACTGDIPGVDMLLAPYRMTYARSTVWA